MTAPLPKSDFAASAGKDLTVLAAELEARFGDASAQTVITEAYRRLGKRFAVVSSFGAESAILLHLVADVSQDIPVLFLDTGKLFGETKRYRDQLTTQLGLQSVMTLTPDEDDIAQHDPKGALWTRNTSGCCFIRKVVPLKKAIAPFDGWASGRKRFQGGDRARLPHFEISDGKIKINPLARWSPADVQSYREKHDLPQHPLVAEGFASIGCMPCTDRVTEGEDSRAGRWRGSAKTECGIHLSFAENARLASHQSSEL
ncbi:phosphoadenylyl-sulfate reductase (thioredoxin) [Kordiimonas sediminis]|uniref:Adenosine 5'-phosphosulfate reductase n=1 Tax=Kordiimonas sediminis TaxID=1735581 RepID=A0A919APK7_9PROT|nr:phosphoadenylyl-sulfate reductase [Kordiimonas sediminis]GHF17160.1 phosphoadenylyl-sulfate reductase (thioredoxin) [Kordiimonas sediminis]